jgi:Zn-dependent protease
MATAPSSTGADRGARAAGRARGPLAASIGLGRVAGIEIGINWTWLIVFALVGVTLSASVFPAVHAGLATATYVVMGVVATVLFFGSILLHELGHAVVARREGMEISGITLWVFGGVARFKGMFRSPGAEFRIAVAGPLVSLALGAGLIAAAHFLALPAAAGTVVAWVGWTNLVLLAFNLLPALPLDGGRILRSALWRLRGDLGWATRVAGGLGRMFGGLMIAFGLVSFVAGGGFGGAWLALIGWFLMGAAAVETRVTLAREALAGLRVSDAMAHQPLVARPDMTLDEFMDDVYAHGRHEAYPVVDGDEVVGLLAVRGLAGIARERWSEVEVGERMLPLERTLVLDDDEALGDALAALLQSPLRRAVVVHGARLAGMLSLSDAQRLLALRSPWRSSPLRGLA